MRCTGMFKELLKELTTIVYCERVVDGLALVMHVCRHFAESLITATSPIRQVRISCLKESV